MTGRELKQLRQDLADAIGRPLSVEDMARLCGLAADTGANTIRKWEVTGPSKPAAEQLRLLAMASDRYPILENFNVFDRHDVALRKELRAGKLSASRCVTKSAVASASLYLGTFCSAAIKVSLSLH